MLARFKPTWMIERFSDIDPDQLKQMGIHVVFSDLDNTLIAWNNPDGTPELREWMSKLADAQIQLIVVSNNSHDRIGRAVEKIGLPFVSRALKPLPVGINRTLKKMQLAPSEVVMVGDQIMTDILAANSAGIRSILVKPLLPSDKWITKPNRMMEKQVMRLMQGQDSQMQWQKELK